jgi:hypothetical protein
MGKMEGYFSTGQSPQWAVVAVEEEEDVHTSGSDTYVFNDGTQTAAIVQSNGLTTKQTSSIRCL